MAKTQNRKLAAILFADIVSYSALMEKDEAGAARLLAKFRKELTEKVEQHQGQIVNFYGDGCLAVFENPLQAVQCGADVQGRFQQSPVVPVRIGLHSGLVVFETDNVYGDAVNQASRLESMGVAGSVLLSKKIAEQLNNQAAFKTTSLGHFEFKNISQPMEVFALANDGFVIPKRSEIEGKLKQKTVRTIPMWLLLLVAIFFVGIGALLWQQVFSDSLLPKELRESRIAVVPYENNTNDEQLDVLGNMAADWITRNLVNVEGTKIVQFENVKGHLSLLKRTPARFALQTGAERMIRGRFYQEGEELIFESKIVDPSTAEVLFAFPEWRGNKDKPSAIINELSQHISGYFAYEETELYSFSIAPKYEAFQAYEEANKYYAKDFEKAKVLFEEAIELDSNFLSAYILLGGLYAVRGKWAVADSIYQHTKIRFGRLPRLENYALEVAMALVRGDLETEYNNMKAWLDVDPRPFGVNYQFGHIGRRFNRPGTVVDACQYINLDSLEFDMQIKTWWFELYTDALILIDSLDQALEIVRLVPQNIDPYYGTYLKIFTRQNKADSLERLIAQMENNGLPESQILWHMGQVTTDYAVQGDRASQMQWAERMQNRIKSQPESSNINYARLAQAYYLSEDYKNALTEYQKLLQIKGESWTNLQRLGFIHAKLGNKEAAMEYFQKLGAREHQYSFGMYSYAQAMIYAALGEKEKALDQLKLAFNKGQGFSVRAYQYAFEFISLQGYPPFEAFVKAKG